MTRNLTHVPQFTMSIFLHNFFRYQACVAFLHVLDLDIHLVNGVCELKLYDKGKIFPLRLCSMCILVAMFLGVFYTGYLGLR